MSSARQGRTSPQGRSYDSHLRKSEIFWVEIQPLLISRGYRLRPRYDPAWTPSWKIAGKDDDLVYRFGKEDAVFISKPHVLDAVRIVDDRKVVLKRIYANSPELNIALHLSSDELKADPRNRSLPVLDVIYLPEYEDQVLIVVPYMRTFHSPHFHCRTEFAEAIRQFLQGLEFMHKQNIAHGDACLLNLMMDETRVVPKGSHFRRPWCHAIDGNFTELTWRPRCSVAPVEYFFIDFGLSSWWPQGHHTATALGRKGQYKNVPELSDTIPYNPFKVDIYQLGLTIEEVISDYPGLRMFASLAEFMMCKDPNHRPTASESLAKFEEIVSLMGKRTLTRKIRHFEDMNLFSLCGDVVSRCLGLGG